MCLSCKHSYPSPSCLPSRLPASCRWPPPRDGVDIAREIKIQLLPSVLTTKPDLSLNLAALAPILRSHLDIPIIWFITWVTV